MKEDCCIFLQLIPGSSCCKSAAHLIFGLENNLMRTSERLDSSIALAARLKPMLAANIILFKSLCFAAKFCQNYLL